MFPRKNREQLLKDHPAIEEAFESVRRKVRLSDDENDMVDQWQDEVIMYNVPHGKRTRLMLVRILSSLYEKQAYSV